jgi:hypothetical protein
MVAAYDTGGAGVEIRDSREAIAQIYCGYAETAQTCR